MALQYYNWLFFKSEDIADWAEKNKISTGTQSIEDFFKICLKLANETAVIKNKEKFDCFVSRMWKHGKKRLAIGLQVDVDIGKHTSPFMITELQDSKFIVEGGKKFKYEQIKRILTIPEEPKYNHHNIQVGMKLRMKNKRKTGNVYTVTATRKNGFSAKNGNYRFNDLEYAEIDKILELSVVAEPDDSSGETALSSEEDQTIIVGEEEQIDEIMFNAYKSFQLLRCYYETANKTTWDSENLLTTMRNWLITESQGDDEAIKGMLTVVNEKTLDDILECKPQATKPGSQSFKLNGEITDISYLDYRQSFPTSTINQLFEFDKTGNWITIAAMKYTWFRKRLLPLDFYNVLNEFVDIEAFTNPFDTQNKYYFSYFETDKKLGSLGDFFDYSFKQDHICLVDPPQTEWMISKIIDHCVNMTYSRSNWVVFVITVKNSVRSYIEKTIYEMEKNKGMYCIENIPNIIIIGSLPSRNWGNDLESTLLNYFKTHEKLF